MVDLSKFVDKEVIIILRKGDVYETKIFKNSNPDYPYVCYHIKGGDTYTQGGFWDMDLTDDRDIVDIQLKQRKTMALSDETIERLAEALAPEAVEYVRESEEYIQFLTEQLTVFLKEKMGEMDNEVAVEIIGNLIADHIVLVTPR